MFVLFRRSERLQRGHFTEMQLWRMPTDPLPESTEALLVGGVRAAEKGYR